LQKPTVSSSSSTKQSTNSTENEAFDTSDELLDNLVKNAALTTTKDVIKQRRLARYAQRQSCISKISLFCFYFIFFYFSTSNTSNKFE
jgi:hypothetical protein